MSDFYTDTSDINGPRSPYTNPTSKYNKEKAFRSNVRFGLILGMLALAVMPVKYVINEIFIKLEANDDIDTGDEEKE